jgi:hypothetical protein
VLLKAKSTQWGYRGEAREGKAAEDKPPSFVRGRPPGTRLFGSDPSLAADHGTGEPWAQVSLGHKRGVEVHCVDCPANGLLTDGLQSTRIA